MRVSLALLATFAATQPVTMNVFVPSLPSVAADLGASTGTVQLTVSLYLATFGVVQLLYGPLSDRFGRKPMLCVALFTLALGSLWCALAPSVGWLIAGRVLQAAGACGGTVMTRAILRDMHGRDGTARGLGIMTALTAFVSAFAPAIGGLLDVNYGWRTGFAFVGTFAGILIVLAWLRLPETNARRGSIGIADLLSGGGLLIRSRAFVGYTLHAAAGMGAWMSVVTGYPHLLNILFGAPPTEFGKWFPLLTAGYVAGNLVTARLAGRVSLERLVVAGSCISVTALACQFAGVITYGALPLLLFVPVTCMVFGQGISQQSAIAAAVSVYPALAGSAAGIFGFVHMLAGACAAQLVASALGASALPLLAMMLAFNAAAALAGWIASRPRLN